MKKIVLFIICLLLLNSVSYCVDNIYFADIENHWAKHEIETLVKNGSVDGYEDGSFAPNKEITIAEFLKILLVENNTQLVMTGSRWPDWYLNTAISKGYISKEESDNWNEILTRAQAIKILAKYLDVSDISKAKNSFVDLSKENKEVILKMVNLGVINGYNDNTFREDEAVTRAQACKMILSSYDAKTKLMSKRKYAISEANTNINKDYSGDTSFNNRYEISSKRLYMYDNGRYGVSNGLTMNQEYVNDSKVINLINALVCDDYYTALIYVPDKNIINSLNVCFGHREKYVNNGDYIFQVRFYENGTYNVEKATDTDGFMVDAFARLEIDRIWDRTCEFETDSRCSERNLNKLESAIGAILDKNIKKEVVSYLKEKMAEAVKLPNDEFEPKIMEEKKFGKYTLDVFCFTGQKIEVYFKKF